MRSTIGNTEPVEFAQPTSEPEWREFERAQYANDYDYTPYYPPPPRPRAAAVPEPEPTPPPSPPSPSRRRRRHPRRRPSRPATSSPSDLRAAVRAAALVAPLYLVAAALPQGGLFRGREYRDVGPLQGVRAGTPRRTGALPRRHRRVPPGAFVVLTPPALLPEEAYRHAFKLLMALVGLAMLVVAALILVRLGAGSRRLYGSLTAPRAGTARARARVAEHLRRLAGATRRRLRSRLFSTDAPPSPSRSWASP